MTNKEQVEALSLKIEEGVKDFFTSDKYKSYLNIMAKFRNYSFNNTMLIAKQMPDASLVAGYNDWKNKFDRHVLQGERGIKILAPVQTKKQITQAKINPNTGLPEFDASGNEIVEEKTVSRMYFRAVSVFDVSQTDGKPLPNIAEELKNPVENYEAFLDAIEEVSPAPIRFSDSVFGRESTNGAYFGETKEIVIRPGMGEAQTLKTAIHETAHAILHDPDVLNANNTEINKREKEVQAESVAYIVCQHYGIDTSDYSFPYVASWSDSMDLKELRGSMETIRHTASEIIDGIDKTLCLELDVEISEAEDEDEPEPEIKGPRL